MHYQQNQKGCILISLSFNLKLHIEFITHNQHISFWLARIKTRQNATILLKNMHFMLWPNQFQKICQIKECYYRLDLANPIIFYNGLVTLLSNQIEPLKNGSFLVLPSSLCRD